MRSAGDTEAILTAQMGRPPRGDWRVAVRCPFGFPALIETGPYLDDGSPFPTLYYLTCPSAVEVVSDLEAQGGVEAFRRRLADDPEVAAAMGLLDSLYRLRRRERAVRLGVDGGAVLERGIGGPAGPERATCLHAYTAALLAVTQGALPAGDPPHDAKAGWERLLGDLPPLWCTDAQCERLVSPGGVRRAAIDLGTNSVRLLAASVTGDGGVRTLVRRARVTQLGAGLSPGAPLAPAARDRTREVVTEYVQEAQALGVVSLRVVGTSACRDASDGRAFVAELGERLGVDAEVVSGPEEATLSYLGATLDVGGAPGLIDVGGGSTELVRGTPGSAREAPGPAGREVEAVSLDLGCVRGTDAWFTHDPPPRAERLEARRLVRVAFAAQAERFGAARLPRLVGVAGTVTTLACVALGLEAYDPDAIHLSRLTRREVETVVDGLAALDPDRRAAVPCMQEGRARVIVAGGEILLGAMEALGWEELTVSERDILDGIVLRDAGFG